MANFPEDDIGSADEGRHSDRTSDFFTTDSQGSQINAALHDGVHSHSIDSNFPGIVIPDAFFIGENYPRNESVHLQTRPDFFPDPNFWITLKQNLDEAESIEAKVHVLINAVRNEVIIPNPKKTELDLINKAALEPVLHEVFNKLTEKHMQGLTDEALGRLLNVQAKFGFTEPLPHEFSRHGIFDPYLEQHLIDEMEVFVQRIHQRIASDDPVMQHIKWGADLRTTTDAQRQEIISAMVQECADILKIRPQPIVSYDPHYTENLAITHHKNPARIIFGPESFSLGAVSLIGLVAHEVEHARHANLRSRLKSGQSYLPIAEEEAKALREQYPVPKYEKYRINILTIPASETPNAYDVRFGEARERWCYLAQIAAAIWAAKSDIINPLQHGILRDINPRQSGGDLRIYTGKAIQDQIRISLRAILTRPYLVKPIEDGIFSAPLSAEEAVQSIKRLNQIYNDPMNSQVSAVYAVLSTMPEFLKKTVDPTDQIHHQCELIKWAIYGDLFGENGLTVLSPVPQFPSQRHFDMQMMANELHAMARNYPDDLCRELVAEVVWAKIKDRQDLPPDLNKDRLKEIINAIEPQVAWEEREKDLKIQQFVKVIDEALALITPHDAIDPLVEEIQTAITYSPHPLLANGLQIAMLHKININNLQTILQNFQTRALSLQHSGVPFEPAFMHLQESLLATQENITLHENGYPLYHRRMHDLANLARQLSALAPQARPEAGITNTHISQGYLPSAAGSSTAAMPEANSVQPPIRPSAFAVDTDASRAKRKRRAKGKIILTPAQTAALIAAYPDLSEGVRGWTITSGHNLLVSGRAIAVERSDDILKSACFVARPGRTRGKVRAPAHLIYVEASDMPAHAIDAIKDNREVNTFVPGKKRKTTRKMK